MATPRGHFLPPLLPPFLLALLLLSLHPLQSRPSATPAAPKIVRVTYTVEDITLAFADDMRGDAGPAAETTAAETTATAHGSRGKTQPVSLTFAVGLLVVNFNRPVHVHRDLNANAAHDGGAASILDGDFYPEELGESFLGLTRLNCPRLGLALPSFLPASSSHSSSSSSSPPSAANTTQAFLRSTLPHDVLLPMAHAERFDLAWLLATLALERHDDNKRMRLGEHYYDAEQDPHRRYVALYFGSNSSMTNPITTDDLWHAASEAAGTTTAAVDTATQLGCALTFLPEASQQWAGAPPGAIVSTTTTEEGIGGAPIHGSVPIDAVSPPFQPTDILKYKDHRHLENSAALELAMERVEIAIAEYHHRRRANATGSTTIRAPADCLPLPAGILNETKATALLETEHVLLGHSRESQQAAFIGVIKGPLQSIVSPLMNPLGGVMTAAVMDVSTPTSGHNLHDNIKDIHEQITASLIVSLTAKVPEIMAHTVPYEISSEMATSLRNRLTQFFLTDDMLPRAVGDAVLDLVAARIVKDVSRPTSARISELVTPPALHLLTRSIAHAVVPTLVHVLTHNPLMDYYCYYCYHKKVYCSYCQYQPSQLYYAQYYTGYFSTYYADYYTDWFKTPTASYREELDEEDREEKEDGRAFYAARPDAERDATWGGVNQYD